MNRSLFLRAAAMGLCAGPFGALALQDREQRRLVGIVIQGMAPVPGAKPGSFRREMRARGYVEERNLILDIRGAEGINSRFVPLVRDLVAVKPDVIVAETTPGALAAKRATTTVPIVMLNVSDPVGSGLVASLAHPGGNVTGVADNGSETAAKSVELVSEVVPWARRLGVLLSDNPVHPLQLSAIRAAAHRSALQVLPFEVLSGDQAEAAFSAMVHQKVDVFIMLGGAPFDSTKAQSELFPALAAKARIPGIFTDRGPVDAGRLMGYGAKQGVAWTLAAAYVAEILNGGKPADMPVQRPREAELFINLKTAASLGLTIPPALLLRADFVQQ